MAAPLSSNETKIIKEMGYRLKVVRTILEVSQAEMAKRLGVTQTSIQQLEYGRTQAMLRFIVRLHTWLSNPNSKEYKKLREYDIYFTTDWFITGKQALIPD